MSTSTVILNGISLEHFFEELDKRIHTHIAAIPIPEIADKEELLTVKEVARLLNTTPQNIHAKKRSGQIPFVRFGGRVLFKRSEVIDSLDSIRISRKV